MSVSAAPGIAKSSQALVFKKNTNSKTLTGAYQEGTSARPRLKTTVGGNVQRSTIVSTLSGTFMVDSGRSLRNVNPALVKPDNSLLRSGLNLNKGYDIAFMKDFASKFGKISNPYAQNTNHMSTLDKIALLTAAGVQIGKAIDAASSKSTDKTTQAQNNSTASVSARAMTSGASSTSLMGGLSGADSFGDIKGLEAKAENKKAQLNDSYQKNDPTKALNDSLKKEGVAEGLKLAKVNIDTSKIKLNTLDTTNMDKALGTIDSDTQNIKNFVSYDIKNAKAIVSNKLENLGAQINGFEISLTKLNSKLELAKSNGEDTSAIESQIQEMKDKKTEAENQKKQVEAALTSLNYIETTCEKTVKDLEAKKSEIEDIKKFEGEVEDKKYDMAKSQDEQLGKTMQKIEKLNKEISNILNKSASKGTDNDSKRNSKIDGLIKERSSLYKSLGTLTTSLASAGTTEFKNSKDKTYKLQNLDKALKYGESDDPQNTVTMAGQEFDTDYAKKIMQG